MSPLYILQLDLEHASLGALFDAALQVVEQADTLPPTAPTTMDIHQRTLEALRASSRLVDQLALFSSNDARDDVATNHLKYLLIPYLLATITSRTQERHPRERLDLLTQAKTYLRLYVSKCDRLGLVPSEIKTSLDREEGLRPKDPMVARQEKITRFKREKELLQRMEHYRSLVAQTNKRRVKRGGVSITAMHDNDGDGDATGEVEETRAALAQSTLAAGEQEREDEEEEEEEVAVATGGRMDEETVRSLWMSYIEHALIRSVDMTLSLEQEMEILQHMASRVQSGEEQEEQSGRGRNESLDARTRAGAMAGPSSASLPPGVLRATPAQLRAAMDSLYGRSSASVGGISANIVAMHDARAQVQRDVFRSRLPPPSMTLDELAKSEMEEAKRREEHAGEAERERQDRQARYDETGDDDELLHKQRAWDDFKDDNPFGHGNSRLRPTA